MGVYSCIFWEFSVVAMTTAVMNTSKTEKNQHFNDTGVISLKYIHLWTSMVINLDFLALDQFSYILNLRYLRSE